ncbi:hypothetical protein [Bradyrhizobium icense]|uniref:hypothetical protein n=1 Tax=Bradyrhizobium icense TaxID=1274631 RepID=UPI0012EA4F12|nr:hypothetical protein [Bradyrhizobium icense]
MGSLSPNHDHRHHTLAGPDISEYQIVLIFNFTKAASWPGVHQKARWCALAVITTVIDPDSPASSAILETVIFGGKRWPYLSHSTETHPRGWSGAAPTMRLLPDISMSNGEGSS